MRRSEIRRQNHEKNQNRSRCSKEIRRRMRRMQKHLPVGLQNQLHRRQSVLRKTDEREKGKRDSRLTSAYFQVRKRFFVSAKTNGFFRFVGKTLFACKKGYTRKIYRERYILRYCLRHDLHGFYEKRRVFHLKAFCAFAPKSAFSDL